MFTPEPEAINSGSAESVLAAELLRYGILPHLKLLMFHPLIHSKTGLTDSE